MPQILEDDEFLAAFEHESSYLEEVEEVSSYLSKVNIRATDILCQSSRTLIPPNRQVKETREKQRLRQKYERLDKIHEQNIRRRHDPLPSTPLRDEPTTSNAHAYRSPRRNETDSKYEEEENVQSGEEQGEQDDQLSPEKNEQEEAENYEEEVEDDIYGFGEDEDSDLEEKASPLDSLGFDENDDLPDLIEDSNPMVGAVFNVQEFRARMGRFKEEKLSFLSQHKQAKEQSIRDKERMQAESYCGPYVITRSVRQSDMNDPWIYTIMNNDLHGYFNYLAMYLDSPSPYSSQCSYSCACRRFYDLSPLHFAAFMSNEDFLNNIINENSSRAHFERLLGRNEGTERKIRHYNKIITDSLVWRKVKSAVAPIDVAAEEGRIGVLLTMLDNQLVINDVMSHSLIKSAHAAKLQPIRCYDFNMSVQEESLLSRFLESTTFEECRKRQKETDGIFEKSQEAKEREKRVFEQQLDFIVKNVSRLQLKHALAVAASKGSIEDINFINQHHSGVYNLLVDPLEFDQNFWALRVPGVYQGRGITEMPKDGRAPPVAHLIAQYGHYDMFSELDARLKLAVDEFRFSSLCSILAFTDDQVKEELKHFKNACREEAFVFIAQIIVKGRFGLLSPALYQVLSNPMYFEKPSRFADFYEDYGLPDYVPLPLETVLCRTGNMAMFETVSKIYRSFDNQTAEKMICEDGRRCLQSIQDMAARISDQTRLALIMMILPFVDIQTEDFHQLLLMHDKANIKDEVSLFVSKKMALRIAENSRRGGRPIPWKTAMAEARDIVLTWNGTVEDDKPIDIMLADARKFRPDTPARSSLRSTIFTEEEKMRRIQQRALERIENGEKENTVLHIAMQSIEKAFRAMTI